jgi:uridine phosphorylase
MRKEAHFTPEKMLSLLRFKAGSLGSIALVPGPRERSEMLRKALKDPIKSFSFLDYEMYTGTYNGKRLTVGNGGRYAADTAISTELLCAGGVETLIRIGSCGSLQKKVKIGDLVIVTGAIRGDGTTPYYVPKNFSTVSHPRIVRALMEAAKSLKVRAHLGLVFTTDALFRETPELLEELEKQGISAIDMVTSAFLTAAQVSMKRAGAILAVSDECLNGRMGFRHPRFLKAEEKMVEVALKATHLLR